LTTLKTAVDTPTPMERVRTTTAVKAGALLSRLKRCRTSRSKSDVKKPLNPGGWRLSIRCK
jgi:hypothetical protein